MEVDEEYLAMLKRAREHSPKIVEKSERFTIPKPEIREEGNITILDNFREIANRLNRKPDHLLLYLSHELGVPCNELEGGKLMIPGRRRKLIESKIKKYVQVYVICPVCKKPDTKLIRVKRIWMLKCEVCGAESPVPKV